MIYIDFEFRKSENQFPDLVCCALQIDDTKIKLAWLYQDKVKQNILYNLLSQYKGSTIVSYSADAEARCFMALGLNPDEYIWEDLMVAYRMSINSATRNPLSSLPTACTAYGINYKHADLKDNIRNMIIAQDSYSKEEINTILLYCAEDVEVLPSLRNRIFKRLNLVFNEHTSLIGTAICTHSKFSISMAKCQTNGIPVDAEAIINLSKNYKKAKFYFIENISQNHPAYQINGNDFVFKRQVLVEYIRAIPNLYKIWPRTDTGGLSFDKRDVRRMPLDSFLQRWYDTHVLLNDLKFFNPNSVLCSSIGSDGRIRPYYNQFGTMTGRNAPPAKIFIPAMSRVFRSLIKPPPGMSITSADWSQQEFFIAAVLSKDSNMLSAYNSGDPYLAFGKLAGVIPQDGTKQSHGKLRDLFKSTVLGLQYGMGVDSLQIKLCADTKTNITKKIAEKLINMHKHTFQKYWKWSAAISKAASHHKNIYTRDVWAIHGMPDRANTYKNWPVQATGASLMRFAIQIAIARGLKVIFPLHDAIYILHEQDDDNAILTLTQSMSDAVTKFFPGYAIRSDVKTINHDDVWLDSSKQRYEMLSVFFKSDPDVTIRSYIPPELAHEPLDSFFK